MSKCAAGSKTIERKSKTKAKKATHMEEIRTKLRSIMGGRHHIIINDEEEEEGDEDVYMYPTYMHLDERDEY